MYETEYAEGGANLHHPAQDRVKRFSQSIRNFFSAYELLFYLKLLPTLNHYLHFRPHNIELAKEYLSVLCTAKFPMYTTNNFCFQQKA